MKELKVMIITDNLGVGGRERRLVELLKGFSEYPSINVRVVLLKDLIGYPEVLDLPHVEIVFLKRFVKKDPSVFARLIMTCREFRPDVMHSWGSMSSIYAIPAARILGIPFINAMIADARCPKWSEIWWRSKLTFPFSDLIVSNSKAGLNSYNVPEKKGRVVRNGFCFRRIAGLEEPEKVRSEFGIRTEHVIGMVGAFHPRKDYLTFLEAAKTILDRRNDICFLAIGDGEDINNSVSMIEDKYRESIIMTGHQNDVESVINILSVGVLTSNPLVHQEGISNAILEYMALAKPVVATRGGGTEELVRDKETGFIIEPMSASQLADKIVFFSDHPAIGKEMGQKGKRIVEREFTMTKMVISTLSLYKEVIAKRNQKKAGCQSS